ncbi:MAG: NADP-dependent oxidoreductase [Thiolinea sp.]
MTDAVNRRILLKSRPIGAPTADNFQLDETPAPTPGEGEILLRTIYLSLDPYMRGRMSDGPSYAEPVGINEVMTAGTVSKVIASNHADYAVGDWVISYHGWQDYAVSKGEDLSKLGTNPPHPSYGVGVLGMPGLTAYGGLLEIGQPKAGETVVVAAATGAVGSLVGQIAKIKGCRVVGIAGGDRKCRHAVETLGFDACIDHHQEDMAQQLAAACGDGIDVYFENVGGRVFQAVLPLLNTNARIPVCGLIAAYNATSLPEGPDRTALLMRAMLVKQITMRGFIVFNDLGHLYKPFMKDMSEWLAEGKIHYQEDIVEGLENAPEAFIGLLEGKNFGKLVVKVAEE